MKRKTLFGMMAAAIIAAGFPLIVDAYDFAEGGIFYNVNGGQVTVTYRDQNFNSYSGNVVIPETVTHNGVQYEVTAIGTSTFSRSANMTSIIIPNSIVSIGDHAFTYCSGLTSVVVPNSVVSLGRCVFHSCSGLKSAVIGNSVQLIDEYEFQYCRNLSDVVIGESVTHLAIKVFFDCPSLRNVTCLAPQPPTMYASYSFSDEAYLYATLTVSGSSMDAYMADANWGRFRSFKSLTLAEQLTLDQQLVTIHGGESLQLTATVLPAEASQVLNWTTSNDQVATVDRNGLVTAVATGQATIMATTSDGSNLSAACVVRVLSDGIQTNNVLTTQQMFTVEKDSEFIIPVAMSNEALIAAVQFDINLPNGISLVTDGDNYLIDLLEDRVPAGVNIYTREISPGVVRVMLSSLNSQPLQGNEGDLLNLHLNVSADVTDVQYYYLTLTNIVLADVDALTYYAPDAYTLIVVRSYMKGDANGDGTVNVGDYVTTANYILGLNPDVFIFSAANVDENDSIDVGDLVGVANIILGDFVMPENSPRHDDGQVTMSGESENSDDNTVVVTLNMDNAMALTAWQMNVAIPEGMRLVQANLTSRATSHSLSVNEMANGKCRLLGASAVNDAVAGHDGALLTLVLEGDAPGNAAVAFTDVLLAEADMTTHTVIPFTVGVGSSAVKEMTASTRIYAQGGDIIVETPAETTVELISPSGMTRVVKAHAGINTYPADRGITIVRASGQVAKFRF